MQIDNRQLLGLADQNILLSERQMAYTGEHSSPVFIMCDKK